ncbi:retrotransposon protein, putative, ty1-copia subclass [Tanacetum coccineum]
MTRNIISFHALFKDGYQFSFDNENGDILVYSNGCFVFKASPCKGIYETVECIDIGNVILNVGSSNELDKSKLWHSRFGNINKKRITQLQKDGVLESFDFKSDDVCESCLLGKMTKSPFIGSIQKVSKLGREPTGQKDKEDNESKIDLEKIPESADEEPIVNTDTQPEVVTHVKPDDISLPIRKTRGRVSKPPQFYYGFHIEEDKISDSTLSELDEPANYKEAMTSPEATKWKEAKKTRFKGFENAKYPKRVCKLQKAIYGLKQASRSWNLCFHEKATQFGFSRSEDESCIYVKVSGSVVVFLVLYVDDIILIGNDIPTSKRLIELSQDTYLDKILKRFKMENFKKENLPLHHGIKISKDLCLKTDEELNRMSRVPYALAVGSIMYAMTCIRPDVSFALSMVSRHQQNPGEEEELSVTGYYDASWQTDKDDNRSQSGWVFLLNGGAVTRESSKKHIVAYSTCEFEYIAACEASKEAIWMKNFIGDLGVVPTVQDPIEIFRDKGSVVALTKEPKDHGKSKQIERKY